MMTNIPFIGFYLNLPIGGVAMAIIFFLLDIPDREETKLPMKAKLEQLDALGTLALVPGVVCLLLALQWGGSTYAVSVCRLDSAFTCANTIFSVEQRPHHCPASRSRRTLDGLHCRSNIEA